MPDPLDDHFMLEICSPDRATAVEAVEAVVPGAAGVFTVLPGHTPLLSTMTPGVLEVRQPFGELKFYAVMGGFAEVQPGRLILLTEVYEEGHEVTLERANAAKERAEARLRKPREDTDIERAEIALQKSIARITAHHREQY